MKKNGKWELFDKETQKYLKKRDKEKCVLCGKKGAVKFMHVFVSDSKGGKGCKENGICVCVKCMQINNKPIGKEEVRQRMINIQQAQKYLIEKENLQVDKRFLDSLKYKKIIKNNMYENLIEKRNNLCYNCFRK